MILSAMDMLLPAIVLAVTGAIFGVLISIASIVFAVEKDDRVETVKGMLPNYNCGACGYPGCEGFAKAIVYDKADLTRCKPGKEDMRQKIRAYLDEYDRNHSENKAN